MYVCDMLIDEKEDENCLKVLYWLWFISIEEGMNTRGDGLLHITPILFCNNWCITFSQWLYCQKRENAAGAGEQFVTIDLPKVIIIYHEKNLKFFSSGLV